MLTPQLRIVAASDEYLRATMTDRADIVGRDLFEVFPDNPADPSATSVKNMRASIERVLATRAADAFVQENDIRRPDSVGGGFEERYWSAVNKPLLGRGGEIELIIHRVEDVTELVRQKRPEAEQDNALEGLRERVRRMEAEVVERAVAQAELERVNETERKIRVAATESTEVTERVLASERRVSRMLEEAARLVIELTGATLGPGASERSVLRRIAEAARTLVGARYAAIGEGTDPDKPFDPWVCVGIDDQTAAAIGRTPRPVGLLGHVAFTGETVRLRDLRSHPSFSFAGLPPGHPPMRSFLGVPLMHGGRSIGNLYLAEKEGGGEFTEHDERVITLLAAQTSAVLTNHRLIAELDEERTRFEVLAEYGRRLGGSLDVGATIERAAQAAAPALGDLALVWLLEDGGTSLQVGAQASSPDREALNEVLRTPPSLESGGALVDALRAGHTWAVHEADVRALGELASTAARAETLRALGAGAFVVAPFLAHDVVRGALVVVAAAHRRFARKDVVLIEELARRAGLALENAELYERAQAAVRSRQDILAIVSHDIRSPLSAIDLTARALLRGLPPERVGELERIVRAAKRINALVADLLDAAALEEGKLSMTFAVEDAAAIGGDAADAAMPLARQKGVSLAVALAPDLPPVRCDRARMLQALGNLLGNAIKFTRAGGEIHVSVERAGSGVRFSIADTGPGIAAAALPHVYDRFWKGPDGPRGTGLGLYITRHIVEAQRGTIHVESELGKGSTFVLLLPGEPGGE